MEIYQATESDLEEVVYLFNLYRIFYHQTSDVDSARSFISQRIQKNDSIIFLVKDKNKVLGFTQLYPTFSSVSMKRVLVLNDLYVVSEGRNKGIGKQLLQKAKEFAVESGAIRLELSTAFDNHVAQRLYENFGFTRETQFYKYQLQV